MNKKKILLTVQEMASILDRWMLKAATVNRLSKIYKLENENENYRPLPFLIKDPFAAFLGFFLAKKKK